MANRKIVEISKDVSIGPGLPLLLIAGPCLIESLEHCLMIGSKVKELASKHGFSFVFKSSFDKANRTSLSGKRGIGMDNGLSILSEVKEKLNVPVLTDVHEALQVQTVARAVDILQIPAFLCRQTDLLQEAGRSGRAIHIKKGQFLHPSDIKFAVEKIRSTGNEKSIVCERGASFGYRDLVVDMRSFELMRESGAPVVFDATHSTQQLGGGSGSSGGARRFVPLLSRAAVAAGIDGTFIETHENPDAAPSDGPSMLPLSEMDKLLKTLSGIRSAVSDY